VLQQISQMREISSTNSLSETLQAVLFGQSINNASSLIGKQVRVLNAEGEFLTGNVEKVSIAQGEVKVQVAGQQIGLSNVSEIMGA
jgi:flagellar basal-body rod modification protein FlgD